MKELWIRVECNAADHDKVWQFAAALFGSSAEIPRNFQAPLAFGLIVALWGKVGEYRPDGDIAGVTDAALERWAGWAGEPGHFARHFRSIFAPDGVITGWRDRQGKLIDMMKADRERKRARDSMEIPRNPAGDSPENPLLHNKDNTEQPPSPPPARGLEAFLAEPQVQARLGWWEREIAGWREGLNMPNGRPATDADIDTGLNDYLAKPGRDFSPVHVRRFVGRALLERLRPARDAPPNTRRGTAAERTFENGLRAFGLVREGR